MVMKDATKHKTKKLAHEQHTVHDRRGPEKYSKNRL